MNWLSKMLIVVSLMSKPPPAQNCFQTGGIHCQGHILSVGTIDQNGKLSAVNNAEIFKHKG